MVEPEQVEQGCVQVVDVDAAFDHVEAELVGSTQGDARLDAAAGQPHGESVRVVVAAVVPAPLDHRRAAELATPDHQGVLEHPALLEVLDQPGARPVGVLAVLLEVLDEVAVLVPGFMEDLDEPDAPLGQPTGQQAGVGERRLARLRAIQRAGRARVPGRCP